MGLLFKKPVWLFLGACSLCLLLMYYQLNLFQKPFYKGICNIDAINTIRMDQDDVCILNIIRKKFLYPPSSKPLNLENPETKNPSMGQAQSILNILNTKRKGFFIECGALDGEIRSNTLFMEQNLDWEGILIEGDPQNFKSVLKKNRKAWAVPACLSIEPNPMVVKFNQKFNQGRISESQLEGVPVQCFPLYSILAAVNRTVVDYFSLDIEGDELAVLQTIPWESVHIQTLSVEFIHGKEGKEKIREFMAEKGYDVVEEVTDPNWLANDFIFNKRKTFGT